MEIFFNKPLKVGTEHYYYIAQLVFSDHFLTKTMRAEAIFYKVGHRDEVICSGLL